MRVIRRKVEIMSPLQGKTVQSVREEIKGRGDGNGRDDYQGSDLCRRKDRDSNSDREHGRGAGRGVMDLCLPLYAASPGLERFGRA